MKRILPISNKVSIRLILIEIWKNISKKRRYQFILSASISILSGFAEVFSLVAIFPFLSLVIDSKLPNDNFVIQKLVKYLPFELTSNMIPVITIFLIVLIVVSALIRLTNLWLNTQLAARIGSDLGCQSYNISISLPYEKFIKNNTSNVVSIATSHIYSTVNAITAFLLLLSSSVIGSCLVCTLLIIDWKSAIFSATIFFLAYIYLAIFIKNKLSINSSIEAKSFKNQVQTLQEGLGSIRDIILDSSQAFYVHNYRKHDIPLKSCQAQNSYLTAFPKYLFESLGVLSIALVAFIVKLTNESDSSVIPLLGTVAIGSLKLLPALQSIYSSWASLRSRKISILTVLDSLNRKIYTPQNIHPGRHNLVLNDKVVFKDLNFKYETGDKYILKNINASIYSGQKIGILGSTGSGKSTFLDLLMGLLNPTEGQILVDGADLHDSNNPENIISWRSMISHVPQQIYLADASFAENIAFGLKHSSINWKMLRKAADIAQILEFIESSPLGFSTYVGERGIQISGGQRQRIGIARAIYKKSKILILDEATSALDGKTEKLIIDSITQAMPNVTIISVAHRLKSLKHSDRFLRIVNNSLVELKRDEINF